MSVAFNRDTSLDISFGTGSWSGAITDGTTLWFISDSGNIAHAYVAATQARDADKDISLGSQTWQGWSF